MAPNLFFTKSCPFKCYKSFIQECMHQDTQLQLKWSFCYQNRPLALILKKKCSPKLLPGWFDKTICCWTVFGVRRHLSRLRPPPSPLDGPSCETSLLLLLVLPKGALFPPLRDSFSCVSLCPKSRWGNITSLDGYRKVHLLILFVRMCSCATFRMALVLKLFNFLSYCTVYSFNLIHLWNWFFNSNAFRNVFLHSYCG